jgi:hypothetical protein
VDATLAAGFYEINWDGKDGGGASLPAGVYRAVLKVDGQTLCGDIQIL